ncbi:MAG: RNA 2'-phosphotransferase [Myxococcota bacterium]|nr:RNA 2'-phosphotransferase [Myxococcota bacterium]
MHPSTLKRTSKYLSWLLRHGANEAGLSMDKAGWAKTADVRRLARLSPQALDEIIATNNKTRLQVDGDRIRANQGHSMDGTPVTLNALENSWVVWDGSTSIWHGTQPALVLSIARAGLLAQSRSHVHLAASVDSRVGKRAGVGVLLEIDPARVRAAGLPIFISDNGVILTRRVPPDAIIALHPLSRRARSAAPTLREALGI